MFHKIHLMWFILVLLVLSTSCVASVHFKSTLMKSILFSEDQPAGKLPPNQRFQWRGVSALNDGADGKHIDVDQPGSDLAAETAAVLAAVSIVFRQSDAQYADTLLAHAIQLFKFACDGQGKYSDSIPIVKTLYSNSGFQDDQLLWAAAWLYKATNEKTYLDYIGATRDSGDEKMLDGTVSFSEHWRLGRFRFRGQFRITKHDITSILASNDIL